MNDSSCGTQKVWIYSLVGSIWMKHFLKQNHELSPAESRKSFPAGLPNVILGALQKNKNTGPIQQKPQGFNKQKLNYTCSYGSIT